MLSEGFGARLYCFQRNPVKGRSMNSTFKQNLGEICWWLILIELVVHQTIEWEEHDRSGSDIIDLGEDRFHWGTRQALQAELLMRCSIK